MYFKRIRIGTVEWDSYHDADDETKVCVSACGEEPGLAPFDSGEIYGHEDAFVRDDDIFLIRSTLMDDRRRYLPGVLSWDEVIGSGKPG